MFEMNRLREPLALLLVGLSAIAASRLAGVPRADGGGNVLAWAQLFFIYGSATLLMAALSYLLGHLGHSLSGCVMRALRRASNSESVAAAPVSFATHSGVALLVLVLGLGVWLRWQHLFQPMRLDEAYSFMTFVNSVWTNVFLYPFPNNHVLNSILERLSVAIVGTDEPGIRAPAFFFGILMIPLAYSLVRRLNGGGGGLYAAIGIAVWPYLVLFSTNGRGYTLLCVLAMLMAFMVIGEDGRLRYSRIPYAALLAALGMLTMPSMLFAVVGLLMWMSALAWREQRRLAFVTTDVVSPFIAGFLLLTLLFYTPVALVSGGLQGVMANKEARALPVNDFLHQAWPHLDTASRALGFGLPTSALVLLFVFGMIGSVIAWQRGRQAAALLWPCMLLGALLLFALKRSIPFPRTWIFLLPFFLIAVDHAISFAVSRLDPRARFALIAFIFLGATMFACETVESEAVVRYPETGVAAGAAQVAEGLASMLSGEDFVCAMVPTNVVMSYEIWRAIERRSDEAVRRIFWIHRQLSEPSRGHLDGWRTVVDAGPMVADVWTLESHPPLVSEPGMDCWQPMRLKYSQ